MSTLPRSPGPKCPFSVGQPETTISHERMKEVDIRGIDGSLYAVGHNGQHRWFCTNLVHIVCGEGPPEDPFKRIIATSEAVNK